MARERRLPSENLFAQKSYQTPESGPRPMVHGILWHFLVLAASSRAANRIVAVLLPCGLHGPESARSQQLTAQRLPAPW